MKQTLHLLDLSVMACEKKLKVKEKIIAILAKCIWTQVEESKEVDVAALIIWNSHFSNKNCRIIKLFC